MIMWVRETAIYWYQSNWRGRLCCALIFRTNRVFARTWGVMSYKIFANITNITSKKYLVARTNLQQSNDQSHESVSCLVPATYDGRGAIYLVLEFGNTCSRQMFDQSASGRVSVHLKKSVELIPSIVVCLCDLAQYVATKRVTAHNNASSLEADCEKKTGGRG